MQRIVSKYCFFITLILFLTCSAVHALNQPEPPAFSHNGGFYSDDIELNLSHPHPDAIIYYTLDGSIPDSNSSIWDNSLTISNRSGEPNVFSMIPTNPISTGSRKWGEPDGLVRKATVIRASAYLNGTFSETATHTYFVFDTDFNAFEVPVISINTNEENLFDDEIGIYVPGVNYEEGEPGTGNYVQRGIEWERLASLELFEVDGSLALSHDMGIRIHGGWTRRFPQKSLRLYARSDYGVNRFYHEIFPELDYDNYNRLILRNSGNDFGFSMMMDATAQALVRHFNVQTQAYRPSVVFINGEYWGLHNIRERYDKHYLERVYNIDPENIDLLTRRNSVKEGSNEHFNMMRNFIVNQNMATPANYETVHTLMDIDNYLDYYAAQVYYGNSDWPQNNIDFWRLRVPYNPDAPTGHDGRWRWLLYDVDRSLGYATAADFDMIEWITVEINPRINEEWPNEIFRNLLENESFYNDFINRVTDHLNTSFISERVKPIIDEYASVIEPLMPEQIDRYPVNFSGITGWENWIQIMHDYADDRPGFVRQHLEDHFDTGDQVSITLDVNEPSKGFITINTTDINEETVGISETPYPWSGVYFSEIPIELTANPEPGYTFSHWESNIDAVAFDSSTEESITVFPEEEAFFTAVFVTDDSPITTEAVHYWIFTDDISNNTPLLSLSPAVSLVDGGLLTFNPAISPYPPASGTDGIMDRVNDPTELNYFPDFLDDLPFEDSDMRGVRARNPSLVEDEESSLTIQLPTVGYSDVIFSFAARRTSNGQRELLIDYATDCENWTTEGIGSEPLEMFEAYRIVSVDFTEIEEANNNADFCVRIRFGGDEEILSGTSGNVRFNNMLLTAENLSDTSEPPVTELPQQVKLYQNYPNPFNPSTRIGFSLTEPEMTSLRVYDITGRVVATLVNQMMPEGRHNVVFDAGGLSSGMYIYHLRVGNNTLTRKMLFVK